MRRPIGESAFFPVQYSNFEFQIKTPARSKESKKHSEAEHVTALLEINLRSVGPVYPTEDVEVEIGTVRVMLPPESQLREK